MSGDTVTSISALQFTNDNKFAYAYSGQFATSASGVTFLQFNTNSEYINAKFQTMNTQNDSDVIAWAILFNNVEVASYNAEGRTGQAEYGDVIYLIIPPFTVVKVIGKSIGGGNKAGIATVTGEVGMAPRVGNLVE